MTQRYRVAQLPDQQRWGIFDQHMKAHCALADGVPLSWTTQRGAEEWLYLCRVAWRADLVSAPDGWDQLQRSR